MQERFERDVQFARRRFDDALNARVYAYFNSRNGQDWQIYFIRFSNATGLMRLYYRVARWFQLMWPNWVALD